MTQSPSPAAAEMASSFSTSLRATRYYSGFPLAHDTYNALSYASDGKLYYVLSSDSSETGGKFYCFDPATETISFIGDLTELCGEDARKCVPQGKSHVEFYECDGKLYFGTHVGYYEIIDGMERMPENLPGGRGRYPGGHLLSYDMATGVVQELELIPGEGILTMTLDAARGNIFLITWPSGNFIHYNIGKGTSRNLGRISANGEAGLPGDDYRVLCRSMFVDSGNGLVYFSVAEGDVFQYESSSGAIAKLGNVNLRFDYFGQYDVTSPGSMGYNWRKIFWHHEEGVAYGVHGNSGYLFRFDPRNKEITLVDRLTSLPSRRSGMFDQFSYGYLGFQIGPDGETIYYLTGGPAYEGGKRIEGVNKIAKGAARGVENLHLVTWHLPTGTYCDHGPVFYDDGERPTYVNSIAVTSGGDVFTLARFQHNGRVIEDLIKIHQP